MNDYIPILLRNDSAKRRLVSVEFPVIEQYNRDRETEYRITIEPTAEGLALNYKLKPAHNVFEVKTSLMAGYPFIPPETRVITALDYPCPHLLPGQQLCLWKQGSTRRTSRWDPASFTVIFAVMAAWRWLACYEIWKQSGEWPLPEAR